MEGRMQDNTLSGAIIEAAITVHRELGPGLLESVYQACLSKELQLRGIDHQLEVPVPVKYRGERIPGDGFRLDILVKNQIVVELKAVEKVQPVHLKQLLTYLKLANKPLGLLINFNEFLLKNGIMRIANGNQ
jgi:GxxExxY protein